MSAPPPFDDRPFEEAARGTEGAPDQAGDDDAGHSYGPGAAEAAGPDASEASDQDIDPSEDLGPSDEDHGPEPTLPEAVRQRITILAAAALTGLPADETPVPLRRVAKFAPNRRARLGGPAIAAQLASDPLFRQRISGRIVTDAGDLGAAVAGGMAPAAADPVEVAALAYLARPDGWRGLIEAAGESVRAEADVAAIAGQIRDA
ncbi:hypothetical protein AB0C29_03200, partial [Actinoplanes sp. NPDC048791]